jgi:threonine synthase
MVYYFAAAFAVMRRTGAHRVRFAVPTGNFGDILAGYYAARMGLPVGRLVLATNENDILARFFRTGRYGLGPVVPTLSPSMDIQVASNFERYLLDRLGGRPEAVREAMRAFDRAGALEVPVAPGAPVDPLFAAGAGDTAATLDEIRGTWERHGYLLDPHTAVGVRVARAHLDPAEPMICLATAHPAKFPDAIRRATGRDLARHEILDRLAGAPTRSETVPAEEAAVRAVFERDVPPGGDAP